MRKFFANLFNFFPVITGLCGIFATGMLTAAILVYGVQTIILVGIGMALTLVGLSCFGLTRC